jgi:putative nucleotidyltransferase with HDIG domain
MAKKSPPSSKSRKKTKPERVRRISLGAQIRQKLRARLDRLFAPLVEWVHLPGKIQLSTNEAQERQNSLGIALIDYRLVLLRYKYQPSQIDAEILSSYNDCLQDNRRLAQESRPRDLRLLSLKKLRDLNADWLHLLHKQSSLVETIKDAQPAFDLYNKMETRKQLRFVAQREKEQLEQRVTKAYQMLDAAVQYADKFFTENKMVLFGDTYLQLDALRQNWRERLEKVQRLEWEKTNPETAMQEIDRLKTEMFEAPGLTKWIHRVEQEFKRLERDHDYLIEKHGRAVIAETELSEIRLLIREAIPQAWARGQKEQLEQFLTSVERFMKVYQPEINSELSVLGQQDLEQRESADFLRLVELTKTLIGVIDLREPAMANHSQNVARLAIEIANQMNWKEAEINMLEIAALLHDVGKTRIPETILTKGSDLTEDDRLLLRKHPQFGAQILESFQAFKDITPWIYYHHERWDGKGYPEGLSGVDIPTASRIIAVAEVYDAMISGLGHPKPMTSAQAIKKIQEESKKAFDPFVVEAFGRAVKALGL